MGLTSEEQKKCGSIIHGASGAAALVGSGMAQIPLSDAVLIAPIQISMITALGAVFDVEVTESAAKGLFAAFSASCVGRATSRLLVGWIPVLENLINAGAAAGFTEAVGWLAVEHFQAERAKKYFAKTALRCLASGSKWDKFFYESKKKWNRFLRKTKKLCEGCIEDLEEQFGGASSQ